MPTDSNRQPRRGGMHRLTAVSLVLAGLLVVAIGIGWVISRNMAAWGHVAPLDEDVGVDDRLDRMEILESDTRGIQQLTGLLLKAADGGRLDVARELMTKDAQHRLDVAAFQAKLDAIRERFGAFAQTLPTWANTAPLGRTDDGRRRIEVSFPGLFEKSRAVIEVEAESTSDGSWRLDRLDVRPEE